MKKGSQGHSPAISEDSWGAIWSPLCEHCLTLVLDISPGTAQCMTVASCRKEGGSNPSPGQPGFLPSTKNGFWLCCPDWP